MPPKLIQKAAGCRRENKRIKHVKNKREQKRPGGGTENGSGGQDGKMADVKHIYNIHQHTCNILNLSTSYLRQTEACDSYRATQHT